MTKNEQVSMIGTDCSSRGPKNGHFEGNINFRCPDLGIRDRGLVETKTANEVWRIKLDRDYLRRSSNGVLPVRHNSTLQKEEESFLFLISHD